MYALISVLYRCGHLHLCNYSRYGPLLLEGSPQCRHGLLIRHVFEGWEVVDVDYHVVTRALLDLAGTNRATPEQNRITKA